MLRLVLSFRNETNAVQKTRTMQHQLACTNGLPCYDSSFGGTNLRQDVIQGQLDNQPMVSDLSISAGPIAMSYHRNGYYYRSTA